jgi:hypothetical protein
MDCVRTIFFPKNEPFISAYTSISYHIFIKKITLTWPITHIPIFFYFNACFHVLLFILFMVESVGGIDEDACDVNTNFHRNLSSIEVCIYNVTTFQKHCGF